MIADEELYRRGLATLIASWSAYAGGAAGARVLRAPGVAAAIFPEGPERAVYNNAVLEQAAGLDVLESAYAEAGVDRFAVWIHEHDAPLRAHVERRGYAIDTTTRAMALPLSDLAHPRPDLELVVPAWSEYLSAFDMPPGLLADADLTAFRIRVARAAGAVATTAMAYDHGTDCGIYNVGTVQRARRRGLASAVTVLQLHDALGRGCETASLQATPMAERLYAALGFRDLGRFIEYVRR